VPLDLEPGTLAWLAATLEPGHRVRTSTILRGGWTSRMRRLDIDGPDGSYALVLRSFHKPFYVKHARGLLTREADILRLLAETETGIPAARLYAVDATATHCAYPSLLMSLLPGELRLDDDQSRALARQLVDIHRLAVPEQARPRTYQPWTSPERVPAPTALWQRAVDVIRREPPPYTGTFLHRDFHPGNVLFADQAITGVVDWVETSWGPADLDVAHCATATALLHGADAGLRFADHYREAGGLLGEETEDRRYWRLLDALGFAPDAEKVAVPWRELGRTDLTPEMLTRRLTDYVAALLD